MPLFTGGRIANEIGSAEWLHRSAQSRLIRSRHELIFDVTAVYYRMLARERFIESLLFSQTVLEEHRKRIQEMIAVQKAAAVDLLRTAVRLADLAQKRVQEENFLAIQHREILNLMGIQCPEASFSVDGSLVPAITAPDVEENLKAAYASRADYEAAKAQLQAQARQVDAAPAAGRPSACRDPTAPAGPSAQRRRAMGLTLRTLAG